MTNVPASHPAVEAAIRGWFDTDTGAQEGDMRVALNAALPHLTADDLRDTPAGRKLLEEGWKVSLIQLEAVALMHENKREYRTAGDLRSAHKRIAEFNPYLEGDA